MEQYFTMNILVINSLTETQCSEALLNYLVSDTGVLFIFIKFSL